MAKRQPKRSEFKDIKTLIKYTNYFINKKSTGYIDESLKNFLPYENKQEPIWKMDRKRRSVFHGILYSRTAANFSNGNASDAPKYDENSSVI